MTSGDLKQLPSLALGNECGRVSRGYSNCWRLQRLLEATVTIGSCGDCWKLRRVAGEARNMMENVLFILIVIFPYNSINRDLRQKAVYFPASWAVSLELHVLHSVSVSYKLRDLLQQLGLSHSSSQPNTLPVCPLRV